jgi:hypothetical protein
MNAHRAHEGAEAELTGWHENSLRAVDEYARNIEDRPPPGSAGSGNNG